MLSVGIITAPRGMTYLGQSLSSYFDEWDIKPHVFEEPGTSKFIGEVTRHVNDKTFGCVGNWLHAARSLVKGLDGIACSDWIMICEDDIAWSRGSGAQVRKLLEVLEEGLIEKELPLSRVGFISPYCSLVNAPKERGWRTPRYIKSGWCGALSLIFRRDVLLGLLAHEDKFLSYTIPERHPEKGHVNLDYAIGRYVYEQKLTMITHSPTLVTHLGECSTFGGATTGGTAAYRENRLPNL